MHPSITPEKISDRILLEDKFIFQVHTVIGDKRKLKFEFAALSPEQFKQVVTLSQLNKVLKISSAVHRDIHQIIVANYRTDAEHNVSWECVIH